MSLEGDSYKSEIKSLQHQCQLQASRLEDMQSQAKSREEEMVSHQDERR